MARPKEFNPEIALDQAMQCFWKRGYLATSIEDLVEATGVQRYGLYSTFGGKHALFLQALDHYLQTVVTKNLAPLENEQASAPAIVSFFNQFAAYADQPQGKLGCLMTNSAVELEGVDREVTIKMEQYTQRLTNGFEAVLERAQKNREIGSAIVPKSGAQYLTSVALSLFAIAKSGMAKDQLVNYIEHSLNGFMKLASE